MNADKATSATPSHARLARVNRANTTPDRPMFYLVVRPLPGSPIDAALQLKHDLKRYRRNGSLMLECVEASEVPPEQRAKKPARTRLLPPAKTGKETP